MLNWWCITWPVGFNRLRGVCFRIGLNLHSTVTHGQRKIVCHVARFVVNCPVISVEEGSRGCDCFEPWGIKVCQVWSLFKRRESRDVIVVWGVSVVWVLCAVKLHRPWSSLGRVTTRVILLRNPCDRPLKTICSTAVVKTKIPINLSVQTNYRGAGPRLFWDTFFLSFGTVIMIYLLSPGGSSTVHIYTQTIRRTIQNTQYIEHNNWMSGGRAPSWLVIPWHLPYNRGKSTEKPQSG